jgi:hypothetical protein
MSELDFNLSDVFTIQQNEIENRPGEWQSFQEKLAKEFKTIQWKAKMTDLIPKIAELFNIKISDIFISSWKKTEEIKKLLRESGNSPDETFYLELDEHKITGNYNPYIEIRIGGIPSPKKIKFDLEILFRLKSFMLKIQKGLIKEIQTGNCEIEGNLKYEGITLVEKKFKTIQLPGSIPVFDN